MTPKNEWPKVSPNEQRGYEEPESSSPSVGAQELVIVARGWLCDRGLADLSLAWPPSKPIPQKDYPAAEPKPTLQALMAAFASSIQEEARQQIEALEIRVNNAVVCAEAAQRAEATAHEAQYQAEQQLAEARAQGMAHDLLLALGARSGYAVGKWCDKYHIQFDDSTDWDEFQNNAIGAYLTAIERASLSPETERPFPICPKCHKKVVVDWEIHEEECEPLGQWHSQSLLGGNRLATEEETKREPRAGRDLEGK